MSQTGYQVIVGIDWADRQHAVAVLVNGKSKLQTLDQTGEAIEEWAVDLQEKYPDQEIAVCLEQSRGALIYALMKYSFLTLIPINPSQLPLTKNDYVPAFNNWLTELRNYMQIKSFTAI